MNFVNFNDIFSITKKDSSFAIKYLQDLFNYNNDYLKLPIKCDYPLGAIKSFTPLPNNFVITKKHIDSDKIIRENNEYQFHGQPGNRIISGNKILPHSYNNPIPFSFPVYNDKCVDILQSNIYYYEVKIENKRNIDQDWDSACISVGFGDKTVPFKSHVGWYNDSVGFHSDDGTIRHNCVNSSAQKITRPWIPNDIVGAGLIYTSVNKVIPFFTLNGKLEYMGGKPILLSNPYFPIIGYDSPYSISVNFSNKEFAFNIKSMINTYSNYIISTRNIFINNHDISRFLNYSEKTCTPPNAENNSGLVNADKLMTEEEITPLLVKLLLQQNIIHDSGITNNIDFSNISLDLVLDIIKQNIDN